MVYTSPWFLIMHVATRHVMHPFQGSFTPEEGTFIVVHPSTSNPGRLKFRFVQKEGHWGYIQHAGGKYWHPEGNYGIPTPDRCFIACRVTLRSSPNDASLFTYDQKNQFIIHKSNLILHPGFHFFFPEELAVYFKTADSIKDKLHEAKFKFVTEDLSQDVTIFPKPTTVGGWKLLFSVMNALADHSYEVSYKQGSSKSTSNTVEIKWEVSVSAAISFFSASASFSTMLSTTTTETWNEETSLKRTISVKKGDSVASWQWQYGLEQWSDKLIYSSNIIADTNDVKVKPTIW